MIIVVVIEPKPVLIFVTFFIIFSSRVRILKNYENTSLYISLR